MKRLLLAALFALPMLLVDTRAAHAQCNTPGGCPSAIPPVFAGGPQHPHFAPFGCGGFCLGFMSRLHFHGPLYNYGPYQGYYPFEPYGPWTSDLRYNAPQGLCGAGGCGTSKIGWGQYAVGTLKNVFHRVNPLANRCGSGLKLGTCGKCGTACTSSADCAVSGCSNGCAPAPVAIAPQAPAAAVVAMPAQIKTEGAMGILTGQRK